MSEAEFERYSRQWRDHRIGLSGQQKLAQSRVLLVGCGALGTVLADTLVRAGLGKLRIADRDFVELSNLQRQVLFDEADVAAQLPKAIAAATKLRAINSEVEIEPVVVDVRPANIMELARGCDVLLDGTDNFEARFLINDVSLETGIPWVHGGCLGASGQVMVIVPGKTACLRCLMPSPPSAGEMETCETAGVLGPAIHLVAAMQALEVIKLLTGNHQDLLKGLMMFDSWANVFRPLGLKRVVGDDGCPACVRGERLWLAGEYASEAVSLCGRNSVQISPPPGQQLDLASLEERLKETGRVTRNRFLLRFQPDASELELSVFTDGRAIVKGTDDLGVARGVYARYLGQ